MNSDDLVALLTIEDRRKIAARVFREECARVSHDLVRSAMIEEARRVLPDLVPGVVQAELAKLAEHRWGGPSLLGSAMTAEFNKSLREYLSSVTVRFDAKPLEPAK